MYRLFTLSLAFLLSIGFLSAATPSSAAFFTETDDLLHSYVQNGRVDYAALKSSGALQPLIEQIETTNLDGLAGNERKAWLINAYNLLVIKQALDHYPLQSVLSVNGFFDTKKHLIGGRKLTLNQLEKDLLIKVYKDARLHFVLVCGALGCPPITNFAYQPNQLEQQLERQTRLALNDNKFIRIAADKKEAGLSQIFEWYAGDFGGNKQAVLGFINGYRNEQIPTDYKVTYYTYDWALNKMGAKLGATDDMMESAAPASNGGSATPTGGGNNAARYVVSSAIQQGTFEIKVFNNLYSQEAQGERSSFFTTTTSVLYGLTNRVNVGFDLRYRQVRYDDAEGSSNFDVFSSNGSRAFRRAVSGFGPKVRIAPFEQLPNFSIQSALWIPLGDDLTGAVNDQRFVDFDGPTWFTQFFNDFSIGNNFSFFAEVDVLLEDIGNQEDGRINRLSTPVTGIFSYFPTPKTTLYALGSYSPFWQEDFSYFTQLGVGAKYQFTPRFELEALVTAFDNTFLNSVNGSAGTVNLGLRFNL